MNNLLELRGKQFEHQKKEQTSFHLSMNSRSTITDNKIKKWMDQLERIASFWKQETHLFSGALISVHYNRIVAKSYRIKALFEAGNDAVVGAKYNSEKNKHIITYYLAKEELRNSIDWLEKTLKIIQSEFPDGIKQEDFGDDQKMNKISYSKYEISKTRFKSIISDLSYVEKFDVDHNPHTVQDSIVTLYKTDKTAKEVLEDMGIDILDNRVLNQQTVYLDAVQLEVLNQTAPYLIAMTTVNLQELYSSDTIQPYDDPEIVQIPAPTNEPTIGVIDQLFDSNVYFSKWVEHYDMVDPNISREPNDYIHGTEVSSIIVDGPELNPWLDDGCGRFKVRHFGVAAGTRFNSFTVVRLIRKIVAENKDIKVWNLSLGSVLEIEDNYISMQAAILDEIQYENDVIFVIAGTNNTNRKDKKMKIGSPADSINSLVVNSVTKDGIAADYSRRGLVLSFFSKPDVSYYGGSKEKHMHVVGPLGEGFVSGTSFAAPWIARKLSYLIDVLKINREVAKALTIDSARGWTAKPSPEKIALYGHGIVPIHIQDIVYSKDDEIKFFVSDISRDWNTYNYYFPVPLKNDKYPYIAKATMCYFPRCDRAQGVDYTNTELNLKFGRMTKSKKNQIQIVDVKGDQQYQDDELFEKYKYIYEEDARRLFRKWDNVKYISENINKRAKPKKSYDNKNWGMEIKTVNRLNPKDSLGIRFGVVVTLKEMNGVNRIDEFIRNCHLNGWIVNRIDVQNRIDLYNSINEDIELE